jgi:prophage regulatory protein
MTPRTMTTGSLRLGSLEPSNARGQADAATVDDRPAPAIPSLVVVERRATASAAPRLLRFPAVRERTGLSRSTIWRLERAGGFPRHRRISRNSVGWLENEIADWINSR